MRSILRQGLKRFVANKTERPRGDKSATVIAVSARKGGVGKTTTCVNLAAALGRFEGKRVLVIDLDPQNHVGTSLASQVQAGGRGISAVFDEGTDVNVIDIVTPTDAENLHVVPPDSGLDRVEAVLTSRIGKEFVLREQLEIARTYYDLILLDCPPNIGNLTLNALVAADLVLVPCDLSPLAVDGVHALVETIATVSERLNPRIDVLGILITRFDARNVGMNETVLAELEGAYGDVVIPTRIGINTDLAKAQLAGKNVYDFAPKSRGAAHYQELAEFVVSQLES
ncbi:MAG: chromosome partitioning protein [Bradymonadia bacterium]|jgi:chromosome partitioning protein